MDTLEKSVELFIEKKYGRNQRNKTTAKNLLMKKANAFLRQPSLTKMENQPITNREVIDIIPAVIKDTVSSYTKGKNTAIDIFKDYLVFLKTEYGITVNVNFPPNFNSQFDRQMHIVKSLHECNYRALDIAEELWMSDRTISTDLQQLEDGITILGQKLKIHRQDVAYRNEELNTIHPIFISANLTQVVVMLKGLENQAQVPAYNEYAVRLAANIWGELSDYGRERIINVSEQLNLNIDWFNMLEEKRSMGLYSTEAGCSYDEGAGNVLDFLKNGKQCTVEIEKDGNPQIIKNCLIKKHLGDKIKIEYEEKELTVPMNSVIRVRQHSKEIY